MNTSQPVSSSIESVDFGLLSPEEIRAISVKQIRNPTTFDTLLHPIRGGLYDPALGAFDDNLCATCHLNIYNCPGHSGHIELPVPVYHVTFLGQLLVLLRAKCVYCGHFKLAPAEVNRFACKLQLVEHGLIGEANDLDNVSSQNLPSVTNGANGAGSGSEDDSQSESEMVVAAVLARKRNDFVQNVIQERDGKEYQFHAKGRKIDIVDSARRDIIKHFLSISTKPKTCARCKGISPSWRKDKYNKIFRKPLTKKDKAKMVQGGFKELNPLVRAMSQKRQQSTRGDNVKDLDEGVDLDSEDLISSDEGENLEDMDIGLEIVTAASTIPSNQTSRKASSKDEDAPHQYVNPHEIRASLAELFDKEREILSLLYGSRSRKIPQMLNGDMFFISHVLVPPNKYRPEARTGDGAIAEAPENSQYKDILNASENINQIRKEMLGEEKSLYRTRGMRDLQVAWVSLQDAVNTLIDSDRNAATGAAAKRVVNGVKQKLEKKEGLFRMNMMGKRVNFAARSVISPDPNIETNEVGVPPVFARKLTYPEPVTQHNYYELKQAVLNGVNKWPGAAAIENENGQVINLRTKQFEERQALANQLLARSSTSVKGARNKKVHRHLTNGDIVLMNRQPTLHKPSIMAHRARVLPGEKTIRMHYANCNTYNADFDGDEMNLHFPQNEIARSEALQIADTDHQYLVATSGKPLRGLIQDHISVGLWLTSLDTFFDRQDYHQLLCSCLRPENNQTTTNKIETVIPAIVKPRPLWTGKQIITTILRNITPISHPGLTFEGKSQTPAHQWGSESDEGRVLFKDSDFICGILDKAQMGPSGKGFVHSVYEAYGHIIAGRLLSTLGRLLTKFLHMRAFTCGIDDLRLTEKGNSDRRQKLEEAESIGLQVATKYVTLDEKADIAEVTRRLKGVFRDEAKQAGLDGVYNTRTAQLSSEVTSECLPASLVKPFPFNQMQTMTVSGAKGSNVNANLISCNLGQQILEGRRVPIMVSGKTLPSFRPFESKVRAGGYITDRFLTGVKPQEYYFHAMAGREGLIDTAVKTSRSGYLQRCLIKGMEGLRSEYDTSVRDSDGGIIQFLYGEDGLDVTKQKHLTDFRFLAENHLAIIAELNIAAPEFGRLHDRGADSYHKAAIKAYKKTGKPDIMDPVLALHNPGAVIGSTSENFASALREYTEANPQRLLRDSKRGIAGPLTKKTFSALVNAKYLRSTIEPGEAVGVLAGQSIGEPSTQMTLNTFHLAGHSAKNVTLGIPRLREIVMTASRAISTPTMTLHLISEVNEELGQKFAKAISKLSMAEIIDKVQVSEKIGRGIGYERAKTYSVRINLFPASEYCEAYAIEVEDVLRTIEISLVPLIAKAIKKEMRRKGEAKSLKEDAAQPVVGKSVGKVDGPQNEANVEVDGGEADHAEMDNDDNDDDDEDADDAKHKKQGKNQEEATTYGAPDEEEQAIAKRARREDTPDIDEPEDEGFVGSPAESQADQKSDFGDANEDTDETTKVIEARIKEKNSSVSKFAFDTKSARACEIQFEYDISTPKLLLLPLVEDACRKAIIHSIPQIGECTYTQEDDPTSGKKKAIPVVLTQGVNLREMHEFQNMLNPHKIFTNDIAAMLDVYGVEACRGTIIREMDAVFKSHAIAVDMRHLNLIADVMTRSGGFTAFSRTGLRHSASPFMKMSFETTMGFVKDAVLEGDWDDLNNPSARIVMGKVGKVGTGAFDVLMPVPQQNSSLSV